MLDKDDNNASILHYACFEGKLELVKYLIQKYPVLLTIKDVNGQTPLHKAGFSGSVELVEYLLSPHTRRNDVYELDSAGRSILFNASELGKLNLVKYLVTNYPNLLTIRSCNGVSPLIAAGLSDSVELVQYMLEQGCDILDKDNSDRTILHISCEEVNLRL